MAISIVEINSIKYLRVLDKNIKAQKEEKPDSIKTLKMLDFNVNIFVLKASQILQIHFSNLNVNLQATMLKKRKHKLKRRNTEPHMVLPLVPSSSQATETVPSSAPPGGSHPGQGYSAQARQPNLADLCDSPTHATAV